MKIDPGLVDVVADLQRRCSRRTHGRVVLTVELDAGDVVAHRCEETELTGDDVRRVMAAKPRPRADA